MLTPVASRVLLCPSIITLLLTNYYLIIINYCPSLLPESMVVKLFYGTDLNFLQIADHQKNNHLYQIFFSFFFISCHIYIISILYRFNEIYYAHKEEEESWASVQYINPTLYSIMLNA